ncbi:type IV secretion system DNA-binding domain-containing protein [Archangium violaceum]|uniref:type IV secretion system DNA-binding domain-containing protein n=1 Tax=Archangium violaceum TaxID=83451 RepID=UPI00195028E7|nr:type IV secretion system DNA-binding domain-containing protein [Archangium violaceum]QRN92841.1 type IV secretion system DNA-binding domain-containing protein [Archangium violaceum]
MSKVRPPNIIIGDQDVVLFVGKRGTGKSTRAKAAAAGCMARRQRVIAFDPFDEWSQLGRATKHVTLGPLPQRLESWQLLADPELLHRPGLAAAIVPASRDPQERGVFFSRLVEAIGDAAEEDSEFSLVVFADEVGNWGQYARKALSIMACESRHWGAPFCPVMQRAVQLEKTARTQASQINSGRQDDPEDLDALAEVAGATFADEVSRLAPREWRHWTDAVDAPRAQKVQKKR